MAHFLKPSSLYGPVRRSRTGACESCVCAPAFHQRANGLRAAWLDAEAAHRVHPRTFSIPRRAAAAQQATFPGWRTSSACRVRVGSACRAETQAMTAGRTPPEPSSAVCCSLIAVLLL
jgi:hypothetical protein